MLTGALGLAGVLTYLFLAIASHTLSAEAYGELVVLWSVVWVVSFTFFRPVEQFLSRALADRSERGDGRRESLWAGARMQVALTLFTVALALLLRGPIERELFEGSEFLFWPMVAALLGFGANFYARGVLAGTRRFGAYAALLCAEGLGRVAFVLAIALGLASGVDVAAIGIAAAPVIGLLAIPPLLAGSPAADRSPDGGESLGLAHGWGFTVAVLAVMLSEQVIVNSGPLFVRAAEGAAEAGFIFNLMMILRAPLLLFLAVAASLLPHLAKLHAQPDGRGEEAVRHAVRRTLSAIAGLTCAGLVVLATVGPGLMQLALGDNHEYPRGDLLLIGAATGVFLAASTFTQAILAQSQARRAALLWGAAALVFVLANLFAPVGEVRQVELGFAAAAVGLCAALYVAYRRPYPRREDALEPGSPREAEVRLAFADELG